VLFLRYKPGQPTAQICTLDLGDGHQTVVAESHYWTDHGAAQQQWAGDTERIIYQDEEDGRRVIVCVDAHGQGERRYPLDLVLHHGDKDGQYCYARSTARQLWPGDAVASGDDKGVFKVELDSGACELIASLDEIIALHPRRDAIRGCHLATPQIIGHRRLPRVLFVLHNETYQRAIDERPRVKAIYTLDADGTNLRYVGELGDHPIWHPREDLVMANVPQFAGGRALALFNGKGEGPVTLITGVNGGGHPSFSPDARYVVTDRYYAHGWKHANHVRHRVRVVALDIREKTETILADMPDEGYRKALLNAIDHRAPDQTVVDAVSTYSVPSSPIVTQPHPSWSRDGRFVLFNGDIGDGSQLYLIDIDVAIRC
jgi:hypothetical protein